MCFSYCVWCARIKAEIFLPVRGMNNSYSCQANPSGAGEVGTRPSWLKSCGCGSVPAPDQPSQRRLLCTARTAKC